tara:strand:- start:107 stop:484 length:378 start_codon:yes stop_codon:yes gene_type:complete
MEARNIKKLYYSISEVSSITGLKQYVLRYWETEFPQLKPDKNTAGNRVYRSIDVDKILEIKTLLYERKFTIKGAKQYLKDNQKNIIIKKEPKKVIKLKSSIDLQTFKDIKNGLNDIVKLLNSYKD